MNTDKEFRIPDAKFQNENPNCAIPSKSRRAVCLSAFLSCLSLVAIASAQQPKAQPERLDLNTATVEQLDTLPEVGPALAKAIVRFREKSGPFRRVEDLLAVPGISKRRLEKIRPLVEVRIQKSELRKNPT